MSRLGFCNVQSFRSSNLLLVVQPRAKDRLPYKLEKKLSSAHSSLDQGFLDKVWAVIEQHLDDNTFSVDTFSRKVGVSRVQLYRRVKALTGMSPNQLLRTTRIKRSAALMRDQRVSISEVAYRMGFNSLSYFTKCFKSEYGLSPTQFRRTYRRDS